jgi:hypothetical protein
MLATTTNTPVESPKPFGRTESESGIVTTIPMDQAERGLVNSGVGSLRLFFGISSGSASRGGGSDSGGERGGELDGLGVAGFEAEPGVDGFNFSSGSACGFPLGTTGLNAGLSIGSEMITPGVVRGLS